MKTMDVSIEEDCTIAMVTPPRKKLKQALLPYRLHASSPSISSTNKKRKLDSSKSPRSEDAVKEENAAKRAKGSEVEIVELSDSEKDEVHQESSKMLAIPKEKDSKEFNEELVSNGDKRTEKEVETSIKKKRDFSVLDMFLKKAQSKESTDDILLLSMSDYESGSSKDSEVSSKSKSNGKSVIKTSEKIPLLTLDSKTEKDNVVDIVSLNAESPSDLKTDKETQEKSTDERNEAAPLETNVPNAELTCTKKDSVTSDDNDAKNMDSDSDICALSSDDNADDEPDKSGTETDRDKDKTMEESDGCKTPRSDKSNALRKIKLTPKQIERRLLSAKKREEKQRLKQEKEKQRQEERKIRRKEKEEKRKEKEEKEKQEKEQKRKEKEMKELKKQIDTEQKQKEKEAKEEERRKREEEKLEAERKKQKAASNFANFFVAKKQETKAAEEESVVKGQNFMPFEIKVDMRVAPITRRNLNNERKLTFEGLFNKDVPQDELYLNELKLNRNAAGRSEKTWPYEAKDVVIIDEDDGSSDAVDPGSATAMEKHHPKLFMFTENRRPPFWGTWRKTSNHIGPRRPFAKDSKWFDYDVDSDDEWEEEEPGESIRGSDDERDEEGPEENEYDVDNDFMVPHGYLSDEEAKADEDDGEDMSPETQKLKLKLLGEQFEAERKTKTSKIKPKVIGCVWQGLVNSYPENTAPNVMEILRARQAWVREIPIVLSTASISVLESLPASRSECGSPAVQTTGPRKKLVPEEAIPSLIRLVHGNINGRIFLIKEFMAFWEKNKTGDRQISKLSLSQKIKEIAAWMACPDIGPMHLRSCWYVKEDVRRQYDCLDVTVPNKWDYTLQPTRRSDIIEIEKPEKIEKEKKRIPLITQFTKKITQEEMQKQFISRPNTSQNKPPKRVALISVPRGEQFQQSLYNKLISQLADSKSTENQRRELIPLVKKLPVTYDDNDDSESERSDVNIDNAKNDEENLSKLDKIDETSHTSKNLEVTSTKEVPADSESISDDKEIHNIINSSPEAEPMATETDNVIQLDN